jgi:hypothetical protein
LQKSLLKGFLKKLEQLPEDKYSVDFIKSYLEMTTVFNSIESELNNLLNFFSWNKQILYFKSIKASFQNKKPLLDQVLLVPIDGIEEDMKFFVDDSFDKIFIELQNRMNDNSKANELNETKNKIIGYIDNVIITSSSHSNWKELLEIVVSEIVKKAIDGMFIEKTISILLNYTASLYDTNMAASEAQFSFSQEDRLVKEAILEYNTSNKKKQKTQFLILELHSIMKKLIDYNINYDTNKARKTIINALKYGYPLPVSSAKLVFHAFHKFLFRSGIYKSGINIKMINDCGLRKTNFEEEFKFGDFGAKFQMKDFNGLFFICEADYHSSIGVVNYYAHSEVDKACLYEAFTSKMKHLKKQFTYQAETLREGLLKEFEN